MSIYHNPTTPGNYIANITHERAVVNSFGCKNVEKSVTLWSFLDNKYKVVEHYVSNIFERVDESELESELTYIDDFLEDIEE